MHGSFPSAGNRAAGEDETKAGIESDVDAADNGVWPRGQQVSDRDVDAITGGAVDHPGWAAEPAIHRR